YPSTDAPTVYPSYAENGHGYFLDMSLIKWFITHYAPGADLADKRLSPMYGDLAGVAPAVVVTAEFDPLRDDGAAYAKALKEAGVATKYHNFDGLTHEFFLLGRQSKAAQQAVEETCAQFRALLHR
ncbi:MAG: alpha/beta hydrolase fold domain-containing protein, partial [Nocardioides sp.]|nr:alpha/beta hydrolase fold domain-containing protein [Nocardioides sp.]